MITVAPEVFEAQMRYLSEGGYRALSLDEIAAYVSGRLDAGGRAVAVTFDDGYLDNYVYAFPVLKKYGIRAAVFVVTDWVDGASVKKASIGDFRADVPSHGDTKRLVKEGEFQKVSISWEMAEEMGASGVDIQSHTKTHRPCVGLSVEELARELSGSKAIIEKRLGRACDHLCWPKGKFDHAAIDAAKAAGYKALFTTRHGVAKKGGDLFGMERMVVKDSALWFRTRMMVYTNDFLSAAYLKVKKR